MAGIQEIEKVIGGIHGILDVAKQAGSHPWTFDGTTLTITSKPLAAKIQQVLSGIDKIRLAKEGDDLSLIEMGRLYRQASDIFPAILALMAKE